MSKRWGRVIASIIAIALLAGFAVSDVACAEEKVIKIGTLFPLTGPVALAGQRCKAAVEAAVEVINNSYPDIPVPLADQEGILGGYKIVLIHADHQGKPDVGKSEAERLFDQEGVFAIIGSYNSAVTKPASMVAERRKKIFMCGASSSAALTKRGTRYFFRIAPTDETESIEFVNFIKWLNETEGTNYKTFGVIYENTEFGKHAAQEAKKAIEEAGFEYVFLEDYEGDTILVIAADVPPEVAELVLLNVSEKYGTDLEGPIWRDIGGGRCKHYDDNTLEKCAYIFEKQGMTFVVFADIGANSASEGIIKSIKPK